MNQQNSKEILKNSRRAALGFLASVAVVAGASHLADTQPAHGTTAEASAESETNPYLIDRASVESLSPEERERNYVTIRSGSVENAAKDGTLWGLSHQYGEVYGLDENQIALVQEAMDLQSENGSSIHPDQTFYLPRLSDEDVSRNFTDQVFDR